jgi:acyl-coenzyme A thioesterase 9
MNWATRSGICRLPWSYLAGKTSTRYSAYRIPNSLLTNRVAFQFCGVGYTGKPAAPEVGNDSALKAKESIENSILAYHQLMDQIKKEQTVFTPPAESQLKRVVLTDDLATIGITAEDMEMYMIDDPRFLQRPDKSINYPANSWIRLKLPLESKEKIRKYLALGDNRIRVGRLLELMDMLAGRICYWHTNDSFVPKDLTIVTASVDGIQFYNNPIHLDKNLSLEGYICYTGTSSMEVRIDVRNHEGKLHCSAYYVFVAREKATGKAAKVPRLDFSLEKEPEKAQLRFQLGKARQDARIQKSKNSLQKEPPSSDEIKILHALMREQLDGASLESKFKSVDLGPQQMHIGTTSVTKYMVKQTQDRNIHGKIFGGMLMRESLELAFVCSRLLPFVKDTKVYFIDDIFFLLPVDVGSMVRYSAQATYIEGSLLNIKVVVEIIKKTDIGNEFRKTTEFNLVMQINSDMQTSLAPITYAESMMYLEARRRIKRLLTNE